MKKILLVALIFIILGVISCEAKSKQTISLSVVLEKIKQVETASYFSSRYFCFSGDTVPKNEKMLGFYKECVLLSDTSVGASFMVFDVKDTTKLTYAYNGKIKAKVDWEKYYYTTNDFSKSRMRYRTVMAPFLAKSKAIIEYTLNTEDSLQIDTEDHENFIVYKISIINKRIEFTGRLPINVISLGSNEGVISEYIIWVNRETKLPFKLQRTLPSNTLIDEINGLKVNHISNEAFKLSKYLPNDMSENSGKASDSYNELLNTMASNYTLKDMEEQLHSLYDVSSKVYMINLTSMFCGPCNMSVSFLKELNQKYDKKDFSFVSLYSERDKKHLQKYINEKEIGYNILIRDKITEDKYKLSLVPTFLFLDKDKKIIKIMPGFVEGKHSRSDVNEV